MELSIIKQQTTWNDAASTINSNFNKIKQALTSNVSGEGASYLKDLKDVNLSGIVSSSILYYDGSKWVNKLFEEVGVSKLGGIISGSLEITENLLIHDTFYIGNTHSIYEDSYGTLTLFSQNNILLLANNYDIDFVGNNFTFNGYTIIHEDNIEDYVSGISGDFYTKEESDARYYQLDGTYNRLYTNGAAFLLESIDSWGNFILFTCLIDEVTTPVARIGWQSGLGAFLQELTSTSSSVIRITYGIPYFDNYEILHQGNCSYYVITTEGGAITGNLSVSGTMTVGGNEVIHTGNISGYIPSVPSAPSLPTNPTFTSVKAGVVYVDNNYFYTSSGQQLTAISDTGIKLNAKDGTVSVSALGFTFNDSNVLTEATGKSFLKNHAVDLESNQDNIGGKKTFTNEMSVYDKLTVVHSASTVGSRISIERNEIRYEYNNSEVNPSVSILFSNHLLNISSRVKIDASSIVTENQKALSVVGVTELKGDVEIIGNGILTINGYEALHTGNALSYLEKHTYTQEQIDKMLEGIGGGGSTSGDDLTDGGTIDGNLTVTGSLHVGGYEVITTNTISNNAVDRTSNQDIAGTKNFTGVVDINGNLKIFDDTENNEMLLNFNKWGRLQAVNSKLSFDASWLCFNYSGHNDNYQLYFGGNAYYDGQINIASESTEGNYLDFKLITNGRAKFRETYYFNGDAAYSSQYSIGFYQWDDRFEVNYRTASDNKFIANFFYCDATNGKVVMTQSPTISSDVRLKDYVDDVVITLNDIANAPLVLFKWNNIPDESLHIGTYAQYWLQRRPELVDIASDGIMSLDYSTLGVAMGISNAREIINALNKIIELEKEVEYLKNKLYNNEESTQR